MSKVLYENDLYEMRIVDDALDEDHTSRTMGYGLFNKETGVREATGLVFGELRWRADQFANMIRELDERANVEDEVVVDEGSDVVLN